MKLNINWQLAVALTLAAFTANTQLIDRDAHAADDIVIADFEGQDYGAWKTTGNAFGPGPAQGKLAGQMPVDGFQGHGLVNSFFGGDDSTGTLTSTEFRVERKFIGFLIGGGKNETKLALQLLIDGSVVRSATGSNDKPGGSETLEASCWDVTELIGKTAVLRIVDDAKGGWGHINVDHVFQSDTRPAGLLTDVERQFVANSRYLHLPIRNGATKRNVSLFVDGKLVVRNEIELADCDANNQVDWWAPMDISTWKGKSITVRVDKLADTSNALKEIEQSDELKQVDDLYNEPMRGQFHFSPRRGWNNDPNGMVYFNGEYHLFFQHNPYGWAWGNMHWGHAVSKDMVHWQEIRDQLLPDEMGPMFSGSAVVDWNNTSGFGSKEKPPLVLIYTAAGNPTVQGIAYSTDGRNFTKFDGNPILKEITSGNRDPKVIWHEPTKRWVMVLYVELNGKHTVHFFTSPNLREWSLASVTEGDAPGGRYLFECPDFFELPVDGDVSQKKWVLLAADSNYAVGSFDGQRFAPEHSRLTGQLGRGFYAPQTFSDIPASDGRRIQIGWWQTETRGMSFNQSMTIPLELQLINTAAGPRMTWTPIRELQSLRMKSHQFEPMTLKPGMPNPLDATRSELVEIRTEFDPGDASEVVFNVRDVMVVYLPKTEQLRVDDRVVSAPLRDGKQRLTIFCDRTGVEVFASDGLCYVPLPFNTKPDNKRLFFEVRGGEAKVLSLEVHELKSAWTASATR